MYGKSQPRIVRYTCDMVQSRLAGATSGPGSFSFSGYCGNTGSGSVRPFGFGTRTGPGFELIRRLWMSTSMRNFGAVAMLALLHAYRNYLTWINSSRGWFHEDYEKTTRHLTNKHVSDERFSS